MLSLKKVLDNELSIQSYTVNKCLWRQGHIWPKFEKQEKPLGFPFFKEAPSSCPKFQINAPGAGNV